MGTTTIKLAGKGVAEALPLDLRISVEATIHIDGKAAQRQVTGWLVDQVGNMLIGGKPELIISHWTRWRVPIILTSSSVGTVGEVGTVEVDAVTGKLHVNPTIRKQILQHARQPASFTSASTN
jgi:hypothetical protein